jgi:hypothetical protein
MNFARFRSNLVSNFYLIFVLTRSLHVADSDWLVPLRADQGFWPSDLKCNGWFRFVHTALVSDLMWSTRSGSNGRKGVEGESSL